LRYKFAGQFLEDSHWIAAYAFRSVCCFLFDGIDPLTGGGLHVAEDVPSRWSPLAYERESERWILRGTFPELCLSLPELFPVGFMSRESNR
jgi:hypothetical protein